MTYLYFNKGQLKMMSEERIVTELDCVEQELTVEDREKIKDINYTKKEENGKLVFEENAKKVTKEKIDSCTSIKDLKDIIKELI